jgi:hypothetical protein
MTRCRVVLWTSTTGVSPLTVIGLCDRADPQVGIDRRDERSGELDAFALDRGEARERERHV